MPKVCMSRVSIPGYDLPIYAPVTAEDEQALKGQAEIIFDFKKKRSAKNHRRFFAFIKQAFDMQEQYETQEIFRKVLQLEAGHYDSAVNEKGKEMYLARSIKWEELDEIEFKQLFSEVVNAFIRVYGHKLTPDQIDQMVAF